MLAMAPITDLAEALSFGLMSRIRRKTHILDDQVQVQSLAQGKGKDQSQACTLKRIVSSGSVSQLVHSHPLCSEREKSCLRLPKSNSMDGSKPSIPKLSESLNEENDEVGSSQDETTITAAYNFNDSLLSSSDFQVPQSRPLARSNSMQGPPPSLRKSGSFSARSLSPIAPLQRGFSLRRARLRRHDENSQVTVSSPRLVKNASSSTMGSSTSSMASTLVPSISLPKPKHSQQHNGKNRRVTIATDVTDLISGEKIPTPSSSTLRAQHTLSVPIEEVGYETDGSSLCSLNDQHQYRLVLDDHLIPGATSSSRT